MVKEVHEKNTIIGQCLVDIEKVHERILYMWQEIATTNMNDGRKVIVGAVIPTGDLYLFVGEGKERQRYRVDQLALAKKILGIIENIKEQEDESIDTNQT